MRLIQDSHSVHQLGLHLIWTPKYRNQVLVGPIEVTLKRLIGEICSVYDWEVQSIEVMPDHVHLFIQVVPLVAPVDIVRTIKSITAVQLFTIFPDLKGRKFWGSGLWSSGTYYGSVGQVNEATIRRYIESQREVERGDSSPGTSPGVSSPNIS